MARSKAATVHGDTLADWCAQAKKETLAWHAARGISPERLRDFDPGFEDGWRKCIATLKLHGLIREIWERNDDDA